VIRAASKIGQREEGQQQEGIFMNRNEAVLTLV
jgi:hypothetical protein